MSSEDVAGEKAKPGSPDRVTALQVAFIGVVAALFGAAVGGSSTYLVTVHSEDVKRIEDRRVERRDTYAQYYGDAAALATQVRLQRPQVIKANSRKPIDNATLNRIQADLDEQKRTLGHHQAMIVLLGSKQLADASFELLSKIEDMRVVVFRNDLDVEDMKESEQDTADALDDFATAARKDLGIA